MAIKGERKLYVFCGYIIAKGLTVKELEHIRRRGDCLLMAVMGRTLEEEVKIVFTKKGHEPCPSIAFDFGDQFRDLPVNMKAVGDPVGYFLVSPPTR